MRNTQVLEASIGARGVSTPTDPLFLYISTTHQNRVSVLKAAKSAMSLVALVPKQAHSDRERDCAEVTLAAAT
jgi:hypothetical protein